MATTRLFHRQPSRGAGRAATPPVVALLLVAVLVPAMALMVLFARRVAMARAARSIGGKGGFTFAWSLFFRDPASVPTLLVVVFPRPAVSERRSILVLRIAPASYWKTPG